MLFLLQLLLEQLTGRKGARPMKSEYTMRKQMICQEVEELSRISKHHPVTAALIILIVRVCTLLDQIIYLLSEGGEKK